MLVRRAVADDAPTLTALTQGSRAYDGQYRPILDGLEVTVAQIERHPCHLVEDDHGGAIGYYCLVLHGETAELDLMFVADHAQGGGVGALLFRHMLRTAHSHGAQRVRIVAHPPAEPFYRRMGARLVGVKAPAGRVTWPRPVLEIDT